MGCKSIMETVSLLLLCLSVGVISVPIDFGNQRIMGGIQASSGEFPYVVSVMYNGQHHCGGFIYNLQWVITAASCVYGKYPSQLKVTVGQLSLNNVDPGEEIINVFSFRTFNAYDPVTKSNDIAMIELATPITIGPYVKWAIYDEIDESVPYGTFIGWGATQNEGLPSLNLRKANLAISTDCPTYYASSEFNYNTMICAGDANISPCVYDEGSPFVQKISNQDVVVGIMSKNQGCGTNFPPSVFTRLSVFYSWIQNQAGIQPTNPTTILPTTITAPTAPCINCVTARYEPEIPYQ
ncbi:Uncharacterized protein APZ42_025182 [Daphnia magna]|uniref:Peptidase S1 domain-containing protein n=1 Tax=Daphnia magna TaxID=35525 RepID=A0A164TCZ5_9CRUS|nr:Uncharacterized protein APZ42_025182 [Daphnia magna]